MYLHYSDDKQSSIWRVVKGGLVLEGANTIYMPEIGWGWIIKNSGGGTKEGVQWDAITKDEAQALLAMPNIKKGRMYELGVWVAPEEPARKIPE